MKGREEQGERRMEEKSRGGQIKAKKKVKKNTLFLPPFAKRRETEVSANNAINSVSL